MATNVLAVGLDPAYADYTQIPGLTPELVRSYVESQLETLRASGYEVVSCLVDTGETAVSDTARHIEARNFDCVMIGAGLRAPVHLVLFEKLVNLVHARLPKAKICFNSTPADTLAAVQRWV